MKKLLLVITIMVLILTSCSTESQKNVSESEKPIKSFYSYAIVDTGQNLSYDDEGIVITPEKGEAFFGQDAQYIGNQPSYTDNGDGTISDNITGLMWQKDALFKQTYDDAQKGALESNLAGYDDWRMPTIKELYSLIQFNGLMSQNEATTIPFIDDDYFTIYYGDESIGERFIDSQFMSSTKYVSTTMNADATVFGVNFIDGRIKGYPLLNPKVGGDAVYYTLFVRGNTDYGNNDFINNGDKTISDNNTGLMWMEEDSGAYISNEGGMNWEEALQWAENLSFAGYDDWRLPNAKELQSIVDYTRSPLTTSSAAIDPIFDCTVITVEDGSMDYGFYWTGTTHLDGPSAGEAAVYISFGQAFGYPNTSGNLIDVHGAGAQRSDPKSGDPSDYLGGFGPQGDVRRIYNLVRLVRDID